MTNTTNPFETLEKAARHSRNQEIAAKTIAKARSQILLACDARSAFFGMLAMRLRPVEDSKLETATVNGRDLRYNPDWVAELNERQAAGFIAHEVMHCAMNHHTRRMHRNPTRWNLAADLACNAILNECKYELPGDAPIPGVGRYRDLKPGLSAEAYYNLIDQGEGDPNGSGGGAAGVGGGEADGDQDQSGDPGSGEAPAPPNTDGQDPGGSGGVSDAGDDADQRESEADWKSATAQAASQASSAARGDLPAGLARMIKQVVHEVADWREILRRFITRDARNEYTWSPPNRRLVHAGLYLPSVSGDSLGRVIVAVDTSGSIGEDVLSKFSAELQAMLDAYECTLEILYHDSEIAGTQEWSPADGPLVLEPKGGGGTDHVPVFERVGEGERPTCLICLTDGYTRFPDEAPEYPVLWAMISEVEAPFGETVRIAD